MHDVRLPIFAILYLLLRNCTLSSQTHDALRHGAHCGQSAGQSVLRVAFFLQYLVILVVHGRAGKNNDAYDLQAVIISVYRKGMESQLPFPKMGPHACLKIKVGGNREASEEKSMISCISSCIYDLCAYTHILVWVVPVCIIVWLLR